MLMINKTTTKKEYFNQKTKLKFSINNKQSNVYVDYTKFIQNLLEKFVPKLKNLFNQIIVLLFLGTRNHLKIPWNISCR